MRVILQCKKKYSNVCCGIHSLQYVILLDIMPIVNSFAVPLNRVSAVEQEFENSQFK